MSKCLFVCVMCFLSFIKCIYSNDEHNHTLMWTNKEYKCKQEIKVIEGDVLKIIETDNNYINYAWCSIGDKINFTISKVSDFMRTENITATLQMSQMWTVTSLTNFNTTSSLSEYYKNYDGNFIPHRCRYNVTVLPKGVMTKELWMYIGIGSACALIVIISEFIAIIYYKKKGAPINRLEKASTNEKTTVNGRARYIISPGIKALLRKKDKKERNKEDDGDTGSLYETLEAVSLGTSDAPAPPPIDTLPKTSHKLVNIDTTDAVQELNEIKPQKTKTLKKNLKKEAVNDIKKRPPLPLPDETQNSAPAKIVPFIATIAQKAAVTENSGKTARSIPAPKAKPDQEEISQALNVILKNRNDNTHTKSTLKPGLAPKGGGAKGAVNKKPIAPPSQPAQPGKSKPKPPLKNADIATKAYSLKNTLKKTEASPQSGPSYAFPFGATLKKTQPNTTHPASANRAPMPSPPTEARPTPSSSPPPNYEEPEQCNAPKPIMKLNLKKTETSPQPGPSHTSPSAGTVHPTATKKPPMPTPPIEPDPTPSPSPPPIYDEEPEQEIYNGWHEDWNESDENDNVYSNLETIRLN